MKHFSKASILTILLLRIVSSSENVTCMNTWHQNNDNIHQESEEKSNYRKLVKAIGDAEVENVEVLLAQADPNYAPENSASPLGMSLYFLVESNHGIINQDNINKFTNILKLLLKANASKIVALLSNGIVYKDKISALNLAIALGFDDVVEHLLNKKYPVSNVDWENIIFSLTNHSAPLENLWTFMSEESKQKIKKVIPKRTILTKQKYAKIHKLLLIAKDQQKKIIKEKIIDWHKKLERKEVTVEKSLQQEYVKLLATTDDIQANIQGKIIENIWAYFVRTNTKLDSLLKTVIKAIPRCNNIKTSLKWVARLRQHGAKLPTGLNVEHIAQVGTCSISNTVTKALYSSTIVNLLKQNLREVSSIENSDLLTTESPDHNNCCICLETCYKDSITHDEKKIGFAIIRSFKCGCKNMWYGKNCLQGLIRSAPLMSINSSYNRYVACRILRCPTCNKEFNLNFEEPYLEGKAFWCRKIEQKDINKLIEEEEEEEEIQESDNTDSTETYLDGFKKYLNYDFVEKLKYVYHAHQTEDEVTKVDRKLYEFENEMKKMYQTLDQIIEKDLPAARKKIEEKIAAEKELGNINESNTIKAILMSLTTNKNYLELIKYSKSLDS